MNGVYLIFFTDFGKGFKMMHMNISFTNLTVDFAKIDPTEVTARTICFDTETTRLWISLIGVYLYATNGSLNKSGFLTYFVWQSTFRFLDPPKFLQCLSKTRIHCPQKGI